MPKVGDIITVYVSGRHDFTRQARILATDPQGGMIFVRWIGYELPDEWVPARWL